MVGFLKNENSARKLSKKYSWKSVRMNDKAAHEYLKVSKS